MTQRNSVEGPHTPTRWIVIFVCVIVAIAWVANAMSSIGNAPLRPVTIAAIGDVPYTEEQKKDFPNFMNALSRDPNVALVIHLGDIQKGDTPCDDAYLEWIRNIFNTYAGPLVYTPGDNEWTDCHEGAYPRNPLERLLALRRVFFSHPGKTLGRNPREVANQCDERDTHATCLVENQLWTEPGIVFGVLHVPGSNNGLDPWTQNVGTISEQQTEFDLRLLANLSWLEKIFSLARARNARVVVLGMQADMWNPNHATFGYRDIVQKLAYLARAFRNPVLILQGDAHKFIADRPFAHGDALHDVAIPAQNLVRFVVPGGLRMFTLEYLRITIDPRETDAPFFVKRVRPRSEFADLNVPIPPPPQE